MRKRPLVMDAGPGPKLKAAGLSEAAALQAELRRISHISKRCFDRSCQADYRGERAKAGKD